MKLLLYKNRMWLWILLVLVELALVWPKKSVSNMLEKFYRKKCYLTLVSVIIVKQRKLTSWGNIQMLNYVKIDKLSLMIYTTEFLLSINLISIFCSDTLTKNTTGACFSFVWKDNLKSGYFVIERYLIKIQ